MLEYLKSVDLRLFALLNGWHSGFFDPVMRFVSGIPQWIPMYALILAWVIYRFRKKSILILLAVAVLITLSDQLSVHIKMAVDRLRPCQDPEISTWVHLVNGCGGMYGFVSSHAANAFAMAVFTSLILKNRIYTVFILLWATVVSYSRIYLGVHYPGDVICGAMLGVILALIVYWMYGFEQKLYKPEKAAIPGHRQGGEDKTVPEDNIMLKPD
jgi:undecaprenyl-diphosphatase